MPDPVPCGEQDVLDDLLDSAQRLAIEVINYPSDERDEAMQRIGGLLTDVACEAGCTHEIATEFRAAMEQAIRDYVAEIEASGGGTVAAWDVGVLMTGVDQSDDASEPALLPTASSTDPLSVCSHHHRDRHPHRPLTRCHGKSRRIRPRTGHVQQRTTR